MIWDTNSPSWWKRTIPYRDGLPVMRYFNHCAKGWFLVVDPFSPLKFYFADRAAKVWRMTPPPLDRDVGTQTTNDLVASYHSETGCQTGSTDQNEAECQTNVLMFIPDLPADVNVWTSLGSSVARLPPDRQAAVYNRLIRFLEMGLLDLGIPQPLDVTEA